MFYENCFQFPTKYSYRFFYIAWLSKWYIYVSGIYTASVLPNKKTSTYERFFNNCYVIHVCCLTEDIVLNPNML